MKRSVLARRTPLRAKTPLTSKAAPGLPSSKLLRRGRVREVSAKRAVAGQQYRKLRKAFLDGAQCARCGTDRGLTVQHLRGRVGTDYLDVGTWLPLCAACHSYAELHRTEARAEGWALSRLAHRTEESA